MKEMIVSIGKLVSRKLVGEPIPSSEASHQKLSVAQALSTFCSDALSSNVYAYEAILLVLVLAGSSALGYGPIIAIVIAFLMGIVVMSYMQTIEAYPDGGGGYRVAGKNLGQQAGLTSGWALMVNYLFTVTVSMSAGVAALTSLLLNVGIDLREYAVLHALCWLLLITVVNLRGVKEAAFAFLIPTYLYLVMMLVMILEGIIKLTLFGPSAFEVTHVVATTVEHHEPITLWLIIRAFAAGCALLTGTEAVSNGVTVLKAPSVSNAKKVMLIMGASSITMSISIAFLCWRLGIVPNELTHETVMSQLSRAVFGTSTGIGFALYAVKQVADALVLMLACVTAFVDFPRLGMLMANDKFFPRQFRLVGDRLVYHIGIVTLAVLSGLIIWIFQADEQRQLPFYAIGGFTTFVLSQSGMVRRHWKLRAPHWIRSIGFNAVGAFACFVTLFVLVVTKWEGARFVIPIMVLGVIVMNVIHNHYLEVGAALGFHGALPNLKKYRGKSRILLIDRVHRVTEEMVSQAITSDTPWTPIHIATTDEKREETERKWGEKFGELGIPLVILPDEFRHFTEPLYDYVRTAQKENPDLLIEVVIGRLEFRTWWKKMLHGGTHRVVADALAPLNVTIVEVPFYMESEKITTE